MVDKEMILVTGAFGFIGIHTVFALLEADFNVLAMENSNSTNSTQIQTVEKLTECKFKIFKCNLLNRNELYAVFEENKISTVIHLAATKGINESMNSPIEFYKNNLVGMINLLEVMKSYNVYNLIFSSSCAIYGNQKELPVSETAVPRQLSNSYAKSKFFVEEILRDITKADERFNVVVLRYFNPIGAHNSGMIGEDPQRAQTNFLTLLCQVTIGKKENVTIYGNGKSVRDYIHIMDVAEANVAVLKNIEQMNGLKIYNVGSGRQTTLMELIRTFEIVNKVKIPCSIKNQCNDEISAIVADVSLIEIELKWKAKRSVEQMCTDSWNFTKNS